MAAKLTDSENGDIAITARLLSSPSEVDALVALFAKIAHEEGWQPADQLQAYVDHAVHFGLWGKDTLIGGLKLVHPEPSNSKLPCHAVWPELAVQGKAAHIAVMAVDKSWRGSSVTSGTSEFGSLFWELAVLMWRYCADHGITQLFLETTPRTLKCYQRLGWPLHICGPLRQHWGEPCYLCSLDVQEVAGSLTLRATRSELYRRILTQAIQPKL